MFVSYEEDKALRKPKWNLKYRKDGPAGKVRLIMWDMTGIDANRFESADLQRVTYSK